MPLGFKKDKKEKEKDSGDLDSQKSSLFSRSKAAKSPAPPANNPYAVPASSNNPYATQSHQNDPYAPKSQSSFTQPPTSSFGSLTLNSEYGQPPAYGNGSAPNRYEKSPVPQGGYGGGAPRYQAHGSSGPSKGYGSSNPYGSNDGPPSASRYGAGGYGGFGGRRGSQETVGTDIGREALFGAAPQRAQEARQREEAVAAGQEAPSQDNSYANADSGYGAPGSYGYGDDSGREKTAEELEEEDVGAKKDLIYTTKKETVQTSRRALQIAEQSEQIGRETLARLGQQGDRIHRAENNLDLSAFQNRKAEEKAKELKTLNRSMFAVHVGNPFTSTKRHEEAIHGELEKRQHERATQEATRAAAYSSQQRKEGAQKDLRGNPVTSAAKQRSLADRAKYQFEADSEDDEMENEIEDNLYVCPHAMEMSQPANVSSTVIRSTAQPARSTNSAAPWARRSRARISTSIAFHRRRTRLMIRSL